MKKNLASDFCTLLMILHLPITSPKKRLWCTKPEENRQWGSTQSILAILQHPYTKLLISCGTDPDLPFGELVKNEPNYSVNADLIREQSSEIQHEIKQVVIITL